MENELILSTIPFDHILNKKVLKESTIYDYEFYQLIFDTIFYTQHTGDSIKNYLYYWSYCTEDCANNWRMTINPVIIKYIAGIISKIVETLKIDSPEVFELISKKKDECYVRVYNHFIVLSF